MNVTEDEQKSYATIMDKFTQYFTPKRNEIRLRRNFQARKQNTGEDIEAYLTSLYQLAENCDFKEKTERIRDQFIFGLKTMT